MDKRQQTISTVLYGVSGVALLGGVALGVLSGGASTLSLTGSPIGAQVSAAPGQQVAAPGRSTGAAPTGGGNNAATTPARRIQTSFDNDPATQAASGQAANNAAISPAAPGAGGGAPAPGAAGGKPKRIVEGVPVNGRRADPFVSFFKPVVEKAPAWTIAVPWRLAALPKPPKPEVTGNVEDLPPLPPVPRRVAGVLYNGSITAILETGEAPNVTHDIVRPGAKVRSGIPGIPDLTIESIAMDRLTLRAEDGRTVDVKLTPLPAGVLDSLRGSPGGGGGFAGGGGGFPGAGGGSFGPPRGGRGADGSAVGDS